MSLVARLGSYFQACTLVTSLFFFSLVRAESQWIERFESTVPSGQANPMSGPAPSGWEAPLLKDGVRDYALVKEGDEVFLRARYIPKSDGKVIFKKFDWDLQKSPFFTWRWRIRTWAAGSTVHESKKEDATASVYVSVRSGIRAYVIKYIWAETDKVGEGYSKGEWNPSGRLMATVVRSGGKLNEWQSEKRNVLEDFKKFYGKVPNNLIRGIGVMTEGDGTQTEPEADYDDFANSTD